MSDKNRKIKRVPKPSREEIKKIKASLNLRMNDPLPKCPAKCTRKAKELGGEHLEAGHRCGECMCNHVAGMGTVHYGTGYCVFHENAKKYKGSAEEVQHRQKVACQQGYPNKIYEYQTKDDRLADIREAAEAAQGRHQLREEVVVLRSILQKYLKQMEDFDHVSLDNITGVTKLSTSIAKLARVELDVTDSDYIHKDEVKSWLYKILRAVQEEVTDLKEMDSLLKRLSKIPEPTTGRV
jgi:hypothetical protein